MKRLSKGLLLGAVALLGLSSCSSYIASGPMGTDLFYFDAPEPIFGYGPEYSYYPAYNRPYYPGPGLVVPPKPPVKPQPPQRPPQAQQPPQQQPPQNGSPSQGGFRGQSGATSRH